MTSARRPIGGVATTTDFWKLAGLAFVLVDHYGLFFDDEQLWWRVVGRLAAPIFFFFIGFARSRSVPASWIALGVILTATDYLTSARIEEVSLNILLHFALLRWALLPLLETHVLAHPWRLAVFVIVCIGLGGISPRLLEYGTQGWLWALFGLAHRRLQAEPGFYPNHVVIAAATAVSYARREILDDDFTLVQATVLALLVVGLAALLSRFRREPFGAQPQAVVTLVRAAGRFSLEIYAVTLFVMQVLAYAVGEGADEDDEA